MQKNLSFKTIGIAACIMAVLGVIPELVSPVTHFQVREILFLFSTLNLFFINSEISSYHFINWLDIVGYILLFSGGMACVTSGGLKIQLLRFVFTLIFLGEVFSIVFLTLTAAFFGAKALW